MPKVGALLIIASFLFAACAPVTNPATSAATFTEAATNTFQPEPTKTPIPSSTPTPAPLPTATITLPVIETIQPHPLALDISNVATEMKKLREVGKGYARDIAWSPDGKTLAVASSSGIYFYDTQTWIQTDFVNDNSVIKLAYSNDGNYIAFGKYPKIALWNVKSKQLEREMESSITGWITKLLYDKNDHIAVVSIYHDGSSVGNFGVWQASTGKKIIDRKDISTDYGIFSAAISPDGNTLAYNNENGIELINLTTGVAIIQLETNSSELAFGVDTSKLFVTLSYPATIHLWDTTTEEEIVTANNPVCEKLTYTDKLIVCISEKSIALIYKTTGEVTHSLVSKNNVETASISPNLQQLATVQNGAVVIKNIKTGQDIRVLDFNSMNNLAVGVSIDRIGRYIGATGGYQIITWDLESGKLIQKIASQSSVLGVDFSPSKHMLASLDSKGIIQLWDVQNNKQTHRLDLNKYGYSPNEYGYQAIKFNHGGSNLAILDKFNNQIFVLVTNKSY